MFLNLLANEIDPSLYDKKISVGEAAIDALLGFITVFVGIALLVLIVWAVGKAMQSVESKSKNGGEKKPKVKKEPQAAKQTSEPVKSAPAEATISASNGIDEETIAVISAAITAYYAGENRTCGFVVKRIKRM